MTKQICQEEAKIQRQADTQGMKQTRPKKFLEGLTGENKKTLQRTKDTQRSLYTGELLTDCEQVMVMELGQ